MANASLAAQTTKAGWLSGLFSGVEQYKPPGRMGLVDVDLEPNLEKWGCYGP